MNSPIRFVVGCSLLVLLSCYGCSYQIPEAEMKAAQEAMDSAKNIHAEELAPAEWNEAILAWEQAQAAVKESKPAKTIFIRAKSRFEKAAKIATANAENVKRDVSEMQTTIGERYAKVKAALDSGRLVARVKNQVAPLAAEVAEGTITIENLVSQGDLLKARTLAKEVQRKVYNAELILAGKKPVS